MSTRMQQRRGTAQQWTDANPVLAEGEVGFETDTYQFKIGNGVNAWASLDYFSAGVDLSAYATETYADQAEADAITSSNSYTDTAIANLVDSSPAALDTLNELAAALGDDANFASTVTTSLAGKSDVGHSHVIADVTNLQTELNSKANLSGATFTGRVTASDSTEARFSVRNIYMSTGDPSGGTDGDVWLKYE